MPGFERSPNVGVTDDGARSLRLLAEGSIEVLGLLPYSSNYTFLASVTDGDRSARAVYKPRRGERPLWDFPPGSLAAREVAAYEISEATGWALVPPTVLREEAPLGPGSLQLFVEHDPDRHYLVLMEDRRIDLEVFAAFDIVINNADRKAGHVLEDATKRLWAVDHGVTFHVEPKLRTVIWAYAEERVSPRVMSGLGLLQRELRSDQALGRRIVALLDEESRAATAARTRELLSSGRYPEPSSERPLPWPLI